jgi:hypothetical protein
MTSGFPWNAVYDLAEFSFIAGAEQVLEFSMFDSGSVALSLNSCTLSWTLGRYGGSSVLLTKTPVYSGSPVNKMIVTLTSADTQAMSGKYVHQPIVTTVGGVEYRPSQGLINIIPRIS